MPSTRNMFRTNQWKCYDRDGLEIPTSRCGNIQETRERCRLKCPGECTMSPWTEWSKCPRMCDVNVFQPKQSRIKYKIAESAEGFQNCEQVNETRSCQDTCKFWQGFF